MNRGKLLMAAGVLSLSAAAPGFTGGGTAIVAEVPFSFHAGDRLFPSGKYVFTVDQPGDTALLTIQERDGKEHELMLTVPEHRRAGPSPQTKLVFDRYGRESFLSEIWVAGLDEGRAVPKSEVARERAASLAQEKQISLPGHVDR